MMVECVHERRTSDFTDAYLPSVWSNLGASQGGSASALPTVQEPLLGQAKKRKGINKVIYFAQAEGIGHIKIGFTDSLDASDRVVTLQTGSPVLLRLLGTIPGTIDDEKDLHRRFAAHRVCGEWFKPVPELLALIGPVERLVCGDVEVVEQSVNIRVLTVGRKQFTKTLLRQIQRRSLVCWAQVWEAIERKADLSNGCEFEDGNFWGWYEDTWKSESETITGQFVIFESGGRLFYFQASSHVPISACPPDSDNVTRQACKRFWESCLDRWLDEDKQLFIGV